MKRIPAIFCLFILALGAHAQEIKMADAMKENGKIYVVIAVILTIFAGIILYLIRLERKSSKLEKNK